MVYAPWCLRKPCCPACDDDQSTPSGDGLSVCDTCSVKYGCNIYDGGGSGDWVAQQHYSLIGGGGVADTRCTGRVKRKYAAVGTDEERLERDARELIDHFKNKMDLDEDVCRSAQVIYVAYQTRRWTMHHQLTSSDKRTTALAAIAGVANGTGKSANLRDFFSEAYRELHIEKHFKTFLSIFYEMCTIRNEQAVAVARSSGISGSVSDTVAILAAPAPDEDMLLTNKNLSSVLTVRRLATQAGLTPAGEEFAKKIVIKTDAEAMENKHDEAMVWKSRSSPSARAVLAVAITLVLGHNGRDDPHALVHSSGTSPLRLTSAYTMIKESGPARTDFVVISTFNACYKVLRPHMREMVAGISDDELSMMNAVPSTGR